MKGMFRKCEVKDHGAGGLSPYVCFREFDSRPHSPLQSSDDPAPILRTGGRAHPAQLDTDTELE